MSKNAAIAAILAALLVGGVLGYALGQKRSGDVTRRTQTPAAVENVADLFRSAARQGRAGETERQRCIRERLGAERYAALVLNPNAATPEDQFRILPCYRE